MNNDFIKLAQYIKQCHLDGRNWRIPAMTASDLSKLLDLMA